MTKQEFFQLATGQPFTLAGVPLTADPKYTGTGSCGFTWHGKVFVKIGEEWVACLASLRLTAVGSKKWEADVVVPLTPA